jgi:ferric iron reductase protein FhuF
MIPILAPLFDGQWAAYGEALTCPPHPEPVQGVKRHGLMELLTHPSLLRDVLRGHARHLGVEDGDLRAAASAWSLDYLWMLMPGTVAAASVLHHGLPIDPACVMLDIGANGAPVRLHLPHEGAGLAGEVMGADRVTADLGEDPALRHLEDLFVLHLRPVFEALHTHGRLPRKILWANARRVLTEIFDALMPVGMTASDSDEGMPRLVAIRSALLNREQWRSGQPNPLSALHALQASRSLHASHPIGVAWHDSALYAQCCLRHLLPGQTHCGPCPLSPALTRKVRM